MEKIVLRSSAMKATDPHFYMNKQRLRREYPNAAMIEILPEQITIIQ